MFHLFGRNGTLTRPQVFHLYRTLLTPQLDDAAVRAIVSEIFAAIDVDNDEAITLPEFLSVTSLRVRRPMWAPVDA